MDIKNIGQLINHLATKAGIAADDQNLKNILSNADLSKIPIHSDLVNALDENLLSIEAAKDNHPEIATIYRAQALNALDKRVLAIAEELELGDEEMDKLKKPIDKGGLNSYKKLELVIGKLKETKKATPGKEDKNELQKTIDDLQLQLKVEKEGRVADKSTIESERMKDKIDFKLRNSFAGRKTIYDNLDSEVRHTSLMNVLNKRLQELDAELKFDEKGDLVPFKKDGSKLYGANHTVINLQSLIDTTMAQNKLDIVTKVDDKLDKDGKPIVIIPGKKVEISGTNQSVGNYNKQQREAYSKSSAQEN